MKSHENNLKELSKKLGFGAVSNKNFSVINTFSSNSSSVWFFSIYCNDDNKIVGVEINTTYFKPTKQTELINNVASFENPITFEDAFKLIEK